MEVTWERKTNHTALIIVFSTVFILSVLFLILFFTLFDKKATDTFVKTDATIVYIQEKTVGSDYEYTVYIDYEYPTGGVKYENREYGMYNSFMKIGDTVSVFVNPDNPEEFVCHTIDDIVFPILCGIFAVIGLVGIVFSVKKIKSAKKEKEE